jgi:hypothetical protein
VARRPLERERVSLDGGRRTTQLMRDSLGVMAKHITGSASISLSVKIAPAAPPWTYFGVAESMIPGIRVLANPPTPGSVPLALVAGHTLECLLKAYLSRKGDDRRLKKADVRHDLEALWAMAFSEGLSIPASPPNWVTCLAHVHREPYHLRYSTGIHGIVLPSPKPMVADLASLLDIVRAQLR